MSSVETEDIFVWAENDLSIFKSFQPSACSGAIDKGHFGFYLK